MRLLRGVVSAQRWGIAQAVPRGWRIAFKGGWGRGVTREVNHQAALLTNGRLRVSIAVMTADNPSHAYGAATQQGVAARLLRGLDRIAKGKVERIRVGLGRPQSSRYRALGGRGPTTADELARIHPRYARHWLENRPSARSSSTTTAASCTARPGATAR
jgi:hypothetical protein